MFDCSPILKEIIQIIYYDLIILWKNDQLEK
jgi:hypothetical protein